MACAGADDLARITPDEMVLLDAMAAGLTYAAISHLRGRSRASVERAAERLRDKLRDHGGGSKAGLVHWYDTHYEAWCAATGLSVNRRTNG